MLDGSTKTERHTQVELMGLETPGVTLCRSFSYLAWLVVPWNVTVWFGIAATAWALATRSMAAACLLSMSDTYVNLVRACCLCGCLWAIRHTIRPGALGNSRFSLIEKVRKEENRNKESDVEDG
jgi:hypothetical protein